MTTGMKPIHPGQVLLEVYMKPATPPLTVEMLSQTMRVPLSFVTGLISGRRAITAPTALQLGVICRTTAEYWLGLQRSYNVQRRKDKEKPLHGRKLMRHRQSAEAA
ncbi:MAG TPA: HigA family addiction module antitoxin [Nitrospiraceae bacterium]|jgi:addiction module HigA family antidote